MPFCSTVLSLVLIFLCAGVARAEIRILAVTNAASFQPGLPAPGSLASVFCTGLSGISGVVAANGGSLPFELAGVTVKVTGTPVPLLAIANLGVYQQINLQAPWQEFGFEVDVSQNGQIAQFNQPGYSSVAFFADSQGNGIVQHLDWSFVTPQHPAIDGEILIAWATGLYRLDPPNALGAPAPSQPLIRAQQVDVCIGQVEASPQAVLINPAGILFEGLAPGLVGVYQINFQVHVSSRSAGINAPLAFCSASCPPFGQCGSPSFSPAVVTYGPSVNLPLQ